MKKIYLDSNVLISLIREDFGKSLELMYARTDEFFLATKNNALFVLSDLFLKEVNKFAYYSAQEVFQFFEVRDINFITVGLLPEDKLVARGFVSMGMHFIDALHAAVALRTKSDFLVTWNERDFQAVTDKIKVANPSHFV